MNQPTFFQRLRPHLVAVLGMLILASIYLAPAWQGKVINMMDQQQSYAASQEIRQYNQQTGERPLWTNGLFSGMPSYLLSMDYPYTFVGSGVAAVVNVFPNPVNVFFVQMLGLYILLVVLGVNSWLAFLGGALYTFGTLNVISIETGHISKALAMAYGPGIIAGVILALRGRYLLGGALTALFLCLEFGANHIQVTYYLFLAMGLLVIFEGVALLRAGKGYQLALGITTLVIAGGIAAGSYGKRLLVTNQYSKETIRGTSELSGKVTNPNGTKPAKDGLDKDYAFNWSYGKLETFNLLIPNFMGGASGGGLSTSSDLYKAMINRGVDPATAQQFVEKGAPAYWGDQPGVGGPSYAGAVLIFLFLFSLFVVRGPIKWFTLAATVMMIIIAWGKNLIAINGLLFDYFPYFNKFRAMTMANSLAQLFMAIGAALGIQELLNRKPTFAELKKPLLISLGATAGLSLIFALLGGSLFSFRTDTDVDYLTRLFGDAGVANEMVRALVADRQSMMQGDAFRSFILIALAGGLIWLYINDKIKPALFLPLLTVLAIFDLFMVDKRFLNNQDFVSKSVANAEFEPTPADEQILQDKGLSYRVWDNTGSFMSDNRASYFHKSIGGYHAAKLRRYTELIEYAFPKNTVNILNMLNTRYVITPGDPAAQQQGGGQGGPAVQQNPEANGNAWFVKNYRLVDNADAEIQAMQSLQTRDSAVVDKRFAEQLNGLPTSLDPTGASISLTAYHPEKMTYQYVAPKELLAVFSEIYYRGDSDWNAYLDGKKVPHFRADYVLRAMRVPAGRHTLEFRFEPPIVQTGNMIDLISNVLLIALIGLAIAQSARNNRQRTSSSEPETVAQAPTTKVKSK